MIKTIAFTPPLKTSPISAKWNVTPRTYGFDQRWRGCGRLTIHHRQVHPEWIWRRTEMTVLLYQQTSLQVECWDNNRPNLLFPRLPQASTRKFDDWHWGGVVVKPIEIGFIKSRLSTKCELVFNLKSCKTIAVSTDGTVGWHNGQNPIHQRRTRDY